MITRNYIILAIAIIYIEFKKNYKFKKGVGIDHTTKRKETSKIDMHCTRVVNTKDD